MSQQYLGELRIFSFTFPPKGWALCNGQTLPINQYAALFSIIGTFYGGNGISTFNLPNLQGCVPVHMGPGYVLGQTGGEVSHTLQITEIPPHTHTAFGTANLGNIASPSNANLAEPVAHTSPTSAINVTAYGTGTPLTPMGAGTIANAGSSTPHNNMSPYLVLSICISLSGIFPSRN